METVKSELGRMLTAKEVADYLGVDIKTVYQYYHQLGGLRLGQRCYRFPERRLIDAIRDNESKRKNGETEI